MVDELQNEIEDGPISDNEVKQEKFIKDMQDITEMYNQIVAVENPTAEDMGEVGKNITERIKNMLSVFKTLLGNVSSTSVRKSLVQAPKGFVFSYFNV